MDSTFSLFDYVILAMGVYVLVAGIRGKGRLYQVENIKEGMAEKFISIMRRLYIALGAIMTVNGLLSIAKYTLFTLVEVTPATDTATAVYDWVPKAESGFWSFLTIPVIQVLAYICTALSLAAVVVLIVITRKMTDKEAVAKQAAAARAGSTSPNQAGHILPVSAFDFDDEPEASPAAAEPAQQPEA